MSSDYDPFSYRSEPSGLSRFAMSPQRERVASRAPRVAPELSDLVDRVLRANPVISAHDHLGVRPLNSEDFRAYRKQGHEFTAYQGLLESGVDVFFDGGQASVNNNHSHAAWGWEDTIFEMGLRLADWHHSQIAQLVTIPSQLARKRVGTNTFGVVLTLESASPIGNEIDRLDVLYGMGLRSIGVVYSESNLLGGGLAEVRDGGLTRFGHACVRRMNDLGLLIDVSHAGDQTSLDTVETSDAPVSITHAGARAIWPTRRMKPDEVIRACAESGGFIGIEAAPNTTRTSGTTPHTLDDVVAHVQYCVELVGIDHVALGPDTHFGDHAAWHREFAGELSSKNRPGEPTVERTPYVDGAENPAEAIHNILLALAERGYDEVALRKLAGGNIKRVVNATWKP